MLYAVIDTNVVVSALLKWNSVPRFILEQSFTGNIIPVLHEKILYEYNEVLHRKKFKFPERAVQRVMNGFINRGIFYKPAEINYDLPDLKDEIFLAVTVQARQDKEAYLVTGNIKHFPKEKFILTPQEMMQVLTSMRKS